MIIGIPREIKLLENRVAMTPAGVERIIEAGHSVWIERGAGKNSGFLDDDYRKAGASLKVSAREVWKADLILKVKEPQPSEYYFFRPGLFLFTFLHLAANPRLEQALKKSKVNAIAYELVRDASGSFPILAPMSEIAGLLSALIGANYLRRDLGGKGALLSPVGLGGTGHVTILGAGHVGQSTLRVAHGLGATVSIYDINKTKLNQLQKEYSERLQTLSDPKDLSEILKRTDLLVGAILVPGKRPPQIVSTSMIKSMEEGSVVIDVSVDQGGCIVTTRPTTLKKPVYLRYGVLHYGVTNMPSLVPRTATEALTTATLPYLLSIACEGLERALLTRPGLTDAIL